MTIRRTVGECCAWACAALVGWTRGASLVWLSRPQAAIPWPSCSLVDLLLLGLLRRNHVT